MAGQADISKVVLEQFGAKLLNENPPEVNPGNLAVSAMLCYRADPEFWDRHLEAALAPPVGRGVEVEQSNIDQVMADWRRAIERAHRKLQTKGVEADG